MKHEFNTKCYSDSFFYKNKNKYAKKLEKLGLTLSSEPTRLIGDEGTIRFYLYSFYWENYRKTKWHFSHFKKEHAMIIIEEIEESIQLSFTEIEKLKLSYLLAVSVNRLCNQQILGDNVITENFNYIKCSKDIDWKKFLFLKRTKIEHQTWKQETMFILSSLLLILDAENLGKLISEKKIVYKKGDILDSAIQFSKMIEKDFRIKADIDWQVIVYAVYRVLYNQLILQGKFNNQVISSIEDNIASSIFEEIYWKGVSEFIDSTDNSRNIYRKYPEILKDLKPIVRDSIDITAYQSSVTVYLCLTKGKLEEILVQEHLNKLNYNLVFEKEPNNGINLIITDTYLKLKDTDARYFFWNDTSIENNCISLNNFLKEDDHLI